MSETKKLIETINMWIQLTKNELKKFTHANIQMDERDIDDLEEIKRIINKRDFNLACPRCGEKYLVRQSEGGSTMSIMREQVEMVLNILMLRQKKEWRKEKLKHFESIKKCLQSIVTQGKNHE